MSGVDLGDDAAGVDDLVVGRQDREADAGRRGDVVQGLTDAHGGHGLAGLHPRPVRHEPLLQDALRQHARGPKIFRYLHVGHGRLPCRGPVSGHIRKERSFGVTPL